MIITVAGAVGALAAPLVAGQIADHWFATERCLAVLLLVGGIVRFMTAYQTTYAGWMWLSVLYAIRFVPTLGLTNSLAMANLDDPKHQFPKVRSVGGIAWIAAGWVFSMVWLQTDLRLQWLPPFFSGTDLPDAPARMVDSVRVAGVMSIGYALFCWFGLPHTPPKRGAVEKLAFAKAFALVRRRSVAVLVIASVMLSIIHFFYYVQTSKYLDCSTFWYTAAAVGLAAALLVAMLFRDETVKTDFPTKD